LEVWIVTSDQWWPIADSYLQLFVFWTIESEMWVQTSVGIAWPISPSICFLDSRAWLLGHVQMYASLDCESRPAMANCWLTPPYICLLDIWCDLYFMMTEDPAIFFGSWDFESGSDMANSWLIPPSVCFLDIWVWLCSQVWRWAVSPDQPWRSLTQISIYLVLERSGYLAEEAKWDMAQAREQPSGVLLYSTLEVAGESHKEQ